MFATHLLDLIKFVKYQGTKVAANICGDVTN